MRITLKRRQFIDAYSCVDSWDEELCVDDRTQECGDMVQFFKGGYTFIAVPKGDFKIIK